jgi:hypothetical protein
MDNILKILQGLQEGCIIVIPTFIRSLKAGTRATGFDEQVL